MIRICSTLLFIYVASCFTGSLAIAAPRIKSWSETRYLGESRQRFDFSCGASCLGAILHQEGFPYIREEEIVREILEKRDPLDKEGYLSGLSLYDMNVYFAQKGFRSRGIEPEYEQLDKLSRHGWMITLIKPMGHPHFVVLLSANNSVVHYFDPTIGYRRVKASVFESIWQKSSLFIFPKSH